MNGQRDVKYAIRCMLTLYAVRSSNVSRKFIKKYVVTTID